jgi:drug/metabolite transporter (DMT)-like permease
MSLPASYLAVVLIWSTTPLTIQWSGDGPGFLFGVAARMVVGLVLLLSTTVMLRVRLPFNAHARKIYLVSGVSIYLTMILVYRSAQMIPSGWLAIIFGLAPIFTGLFSALILKSHNLHGTNLLGVVLGFSGLLIVFSEGLTFHEGAWIGVLMVAVAASMQSGGAVLIKYLKPKMSSLGVTTGGMMVATPLFVVTCLLAQEWPNEIPERALYSILYLGVFGSALGFTLYYYVLERTGPDMVALITMLTPVISLLIGAQFNSEVISAQVWLGLFFILSGLALYVFGNKAVRFVTNYSA